VERTATGYVIDFPARMSEPVTTPPLLTAAIGYTPVEVVADRFNYLALLETVDQVRDLGV
jgi:hypothetical protein